MMYADLLAKRLDREIQICAEDPKLSAGGISIWRQDDVVFASFSSGREGSSGVFALRCSQFDAEPPSVAMVDQQTLEDLPPERWTPGVCHGVHPVTGRGFVCIQGVAEYHTHPSHLEDSWDRYRNRFRIPQTIRRLLQKAGAIE